MPSAKVLSPATGRRPARSRRMISASAWASTASDFAPEIVCRSRYRAADLGLSAYTVYPAAISEATHGPRSVSIPTSTSSGGSGSRPGSCKCSAISACNRVTPASPFGKRLFARTLPCSSTSSTS